MRAVHPRRIILWIYHMDIIIKISVVFVSGGLRGGAGALGPIATWASRTPETSSVLHSHRPSRDSYKNLKIKSPGICKKLNLVFCAPEVLRVGRAGPGRVSINNSEEVSSEEVSGVLEAQVPSVPRSHRSQGPSGPTVPSVPPKVSHPRYPTQGIPPKGSLGTHI